MVRGRNSATIQEKMLYPACVLIITAMNWDARNRIMTPRLKISLYKLALVGALFYTSYGLSNHYAASLAYVPEIAFAWERNIPFWAWTIVPYWSLNLMYAAAFFLLICAEVFQVACRRFYCFCRFRRQHHLRAGLFQFRRCLRQIPTAAVNQQPSQHHRRAASATPEILPINTSSRTRAVFSLPHSQYAMFSRTPAR